MQQIAEVFADYCAAGLLADGRPLQGETEDLEALVEYECWRADFRRGRAHLVTLEGEVLTHAQVDRARERRWRAVRRMGRGAR